MSNHRGIARFYGRWAGVYDHLASRTPGITGVRKKAVSSLNISPGETVVEMGCGTGANLEFLRRAVGPEGQVIGIDLTPGMLDRAHERVDRNQWSNVALLRADATAPPLGEVDVVFATFVIGMLEDPSAAIHAWSRRMSGGGRIGLLDATMSDEACGVFLNPVFGAFVALTAPPTLQLRYEDQPAAVLEERVSTARAALAERGDIRVDERLVGGFLRLTVGGVE